MKKFIKTIFLLVTLILTAFPIWSAISDYAFTSTTGNAYVEITDGTLHGTSANDNEVFNNIPLGFDFNYNGTVYSSISIATNGFIAMGSSVTTATLPISTGTTNNVIVPFARDIKSQDTGTLMSAVSGQAPNRVFTVQWHNYRRTPSTATTDTINFQIKLHETTNVITFHYGHMNIVTVSTASTVQCGLRGASNTEFNNRMTTTDWTATVPGTANNSTCTINATVYPPMGLVFTWTPPQAGNPPNPAQAVSPLNGATNVSIHANLVWQSGGGVITGYKVYLGTDTPPANIVNGALQTGTVYDPVNDFAYSTVYYWKIVPTNDFGDAPDCPIWSFTTMPDPTVTVFPYTENWDEVTVPNVPPSWTIINANADAFTWQTVNTVSESAPNSLRCAYNSSSAIPMDDWAVSPPLQLTGETTYRLRFYYRAQSASNPEKLEVKYGNGNSVSALTELLFQNANITTTTFTQAEAFLTPVTSGIYYIGFHGYSNANMYYLYIDSINFSEYVPTFNPPQNLTGSTGDGTVHLSWQAPAARALSGYHVFRNEQQLTTSLLTTTTYIDNTASAGVAATYYVKAYYTNPTGVSEASNAVTITPAFNTPQNLTAVSNATSVVLSWQNPAGNMQSGFKVYRNGNALTPNPITTLNYTDTSLSTGMMFEYYVTAVYANGESSPSNSVNGELLAPPTMLTAEVSNQNITLTWVSPFLVNRAKSMTRDLQGFKIYRNSSLLTTINNPAATTYTDANLEPGTYSYAVSAVYTLGESPQAGPVSGTVAYIFPAPSQLTAIGNLTNIVLIWHRPTPLLTNLSGYRIYRDGLAMGHGLVTDTTYTDTSIANNVTYSYYVVAVYTNPNGVSEPSNTVTATGGEALVPPVNLQGTVSQDSVFLTWQAPGRPLLGYKVYRNGNVAVTLTDPAAASYVDTGLPNGLYVYYVTALYTMGESAPSNAVTVTVNVTAAENTVIPITKTALRGNYPNPFRTETKITFDLAKTGSCTLEIYNLAGQKIRTLVCSKSLSGRQTVTWKGDDEQGNKVAGGIYFCRLTSGNVVSVQKLILLN